MGFNSLRVLLVEDSEPDAKLVARELGKNFDVTWTRVDTAAAMSDALDKQGWDLIVSDYSMPSFDAIAAHSLMRCKGLDLPFICVSGAIGEKTAVETMRSGVHDYFSKGALGPLFTAAIERELGEAVLRADRKKMQEQLMVSDRMVSMGTLAAGVAHEINNPLASVIANLELAVREIAGRVAKSEDDFSDLSEELRDSLEAAQRIRRIVRDLQIFSRSEQQTRESVDMHLVLESALRLAANETHHRARVVKNFGPVPLVEASAARLGQVFLNLIVNAAQAIEEGRAESNEICISTETDDVGRAVVTIADSGAGMLPAVVEKLFTPFFTTKPVGVGTGLGLAICQRIVTQVGGTIAVESEVGKGTVFRVVLPEVADKAREERVPTVVATEAATRRGRVLVVDDEPLLLKAIVRTLSREHTVTATMKGIDALRLIDAGERFDMILCDLMMPQMTGMDLYAALLPIAEDQAKRMVFMTGGVFTQRARTFLDEIPNQRIDKPFDSVQLQALANERVR